MSTERPDERDVQFERALLRSANTDNPTHDTRAAWERFSAVTAYVASRAESVSAVHRVDKPAASNDVSAPLATPTPQLVRAGAGITLSGVAVGVVVGALLSAGVWFWVGSESPSTAFLQVNTAPAPSIAHSMLSAQQGLATASMPLPSATGGGQLGLRSLLSATGAERAADGHRSPSRQSASRGKDGSKPKKAASSPTSWPGSSLAAQVRLLDNAREALRAGRPIYALDWVERARTEFPDSVLTPDWDFVEIEALRKQGAAVAQQRAQTFLRKYPTDPHAPQVQRGLRTQNPGTP